ncbi:MAG: RNA methyltransferase [Bacteroidetes bacterium]|nr:RNA methyltransferase [Bacteroidota bacterium]
MNRKIRSELIQFFSDMVTPERERLFHMVLQNRTKYITVVLENFYQSHNASAVLRSCDCFGVHDIHIIENGNKYSINPDIALGSSKWVSIIKYNKLDENTSVCYQELRKNGYRIIATTPHMGSKMLDEFNLLNGKIALVFGTELEGLSKFALKNADEHLKIPMFGFTESFNVSVSASIILYKLTSELRKSGIDWELTNDEKQEIILQWLRRSVKRSKILEIEFLKKNKS